ncbi:MAG TPA: CHAD domain-containing protein [Vicinamibacteria bacterium]|nr:CHAD domain-containing protein [Vicinamibacteria bacterium]
MTTPQPTESEPGTRLLRERVRTVFRHLPGALAGNEERLHQMRIAARRLRVALPLLARKPGGRRVRRALRALRELTRTAGASRDLDVMCALAEERWKQPGALTAEGRVLRRRLRGARGRSRRQMAEALLDLEIARLRRDLRAATSRGGELLFTILLRVRDARDKGGERLIAGFHRLGETFDGAALHRIRIRARRLRYTAELQDLLKSAPSDAARQWKDLQERLGEVRDHEVLSQWFARQAARTRPEQDALRAEAEALAAWFAEESHRHHRELLAAGPVGIVERALAEMGQGRTEFRAGA